MLVRNHPSYKGDLYDGRLDTYTLLDLDGVGNDTGRLGTARAFSEILAEVWCCDGKHAPVANQLVE
jgi:hypothetical protein